MVEQRNGRCNRNEKHKPREKKIMQVIESTRNRKKSRTKFDLKLGCND